MEPSTHAKNIAAGMSEKASWLAWTLCVLTFAMIVGVVALVSLNPDELGDLSFSVVVVTSVIVGSAVASRHPRNVVGWLFIAGALISTVRALSEQYAVYGIITDPGSLPAAEAAAWFAHVIEFFGPVAIFILIPLYFPNGRPVSPRWGVVAWLALGVLPVATLSSAFAPGEIITGTVIRNPLGDTALSTLGRVLGPALFVWYIGLIFASAASLIVRFRRSHGVERQQIKWFTFAAAFIPIWFMTNAPVEDAFPVLFQVVDSLIIAAVPVAAGIAILRYRLYDIDLLINRALVYGVLTVTLVGVYLVGVVLLQEAFRSVTGSDSQLAIVASTIGIAALFNPLRRLIQRFIDRRFYRRKYNAARTLEEFGHRLRGDMDLDGLEHGLMIAVRKTMQPEHTSLWLRDPRREDD